MLVSAIQRHWVPALAGRSQGINRDRRRAVPGVAILKPAKLNPDDIERIKRQDESGEDWAAVDQQGIGDCFLLATLQAYSNTEKAGSVCVIKLGGAIRITIS